MAGELKIGPREVIQRMLKMEHGARKCARIMLFMNRVQLVDTLIALPDDVVITLAREMAKLKAKIPDLVKEREVVEKELGKVAEIIDVAPPDPQGAKTFAFFGELEPTTLISLGTTLDERAFAAVVCNAPVEQGTLLLGAIGSRKLRRDLIEEMTRLGSQNRESAEHLADQVRGEIASGYRKLRDRLGVVQTRMIKKQLTRVLTKGDTGHSDTVQLKKLETDKLSEDEQGGGGNPLGSGAASKSFGKVEIPLAQLLEEADEFDLQTWLGNVPADHLALALHNDDGRLTRVIGNNLSPRRWRDVEVEMDRLKNVTDDKIQSAQKAIVKRIQAMQ